MHWVVSHRLVWFRRRLGVGFPVFIGRAVADQSEPGCDCSSGEGHDHHEQLGSCYVHSLICCCRCCCPRRCYCCAAVLLLLLRREDDKTENDDGGGDEDRRRWRHRQRRQWCWWWRELINVSLDGIWLGNAWLVTSVGCSSYSCHQLALEKSRAVSQRLYSYE